MLIYLNECILNYKCKWNNFNVVCWDLEKIKTGEVQNVFDYLFVKKLCIFHKKKEGKRTHTSLKHSVIWTEIFCRISFVLFYTQMKYHGRKFII